MIVSDVQSVEWLTDYISLQVAKPSPASNWGRDHPMIDDPQQAQLTKLSRHSTGNIQQLSIIQRLTHSFPFLSIYLYKV